LLLAIPTESDYAVSGKKTDCYVAFIGVDLSEKKLKDLLQECLPQVTVELWHIL
jgi:hypothetical protein